MFVLVQIVVAGLLFGDDVRASVANGPSQSGIAKGPVATSLTPAGPVKSENESQPRRRAGTPPKAEPELQFEGTITAASATSITVHDSHGNDVVLALTPATSIRKGDTTLAPGDLKVGDQVHVKATSANNVNTAQQIEVQTPDTQQEPELEIEGIITAASATSITVHDSHNADVVVALTSMTVIRKGETIIAAADLKIGERVHVKATSANNVNTAVEVIVQNEEQHPLEITGTITAASSSSITVHDAHGADVILMLTASTIIRKGDATLAATDLKVGDHVEAEAIFDGTVNNAISIHVDGSGDNSHGHH
jgi:archaellum component FlaF (FlaF/FlaG flagellin family)